MIDRATDMYRRTQVETANQAHLITLMYEGVASFLIRAALGIEQSNHEQAQHYTEKASAIINELLATLDYQAGSDMAVRLSSIYLMSIREILAARLKRDSQHMRKIAALYADLKSAWAILARNTRNTS